ncbi:MAG TPA: DUF4386 domain-containing protein [Ktedonobacteraceae bacterium]
MATNARMSASKQTATMKEDTHMTSTEQTAVNRPTTNDYTPASATAQTPQAKRLVSANQRRAEIVIASLFLLTAVTSGVGAFTLDPLLKASNYLALVFPNQGTVTLDCVLWSINNIGIVFIAVFAFPMLRKLDETLATGYLASRIIEGTIMMVGIIATLLLIPLSQAFLQAGIPQSSWFLTIGEVLKQAKFLGLSVVSLPILGLGGSLFTWMLFRFRLVPRIISVVGLIGYLIVLFGSIAGWFGLVNLAPGDNGTIFAIPVAVFEIILLPFWLFFKGFKTPEASERIVSAE